MFLPGDLFILNIYFYLHNVLTSVKCLGMELVYILYVIKFKRCINYAFVSS